MSSTQPHPPVARRIRRSAACASWLALLALAVIAMLAATTGARAGIKVAMSSTSGLAVTTDQAAANEVINILGKLTPENTVGNWDVDPLCVANVLDPFGTGCIDESDQNCSVVQGPDAGLGFGTRVVRCSRISAGIGVNTRGGNDQVLIGNARNELVVVDAGSGNDRVSVGTTVALLGVETPFGPWNVSLGEGDDTYLGSRGPDTVMAADGADQLDPGEGSDLVLAGHGNDRVNAGAERSLLAGGNEPDAYNGGPGVDTLDYSSRTVGIFAAVISPSGGAPNELDSIVAFERILGGSGNDSILGFSSEGGAGDDVLTGGDAGDVIVGGRGADVIRGFAGNDVLDANDGVADVRISCSTGIDRVELDLRDPNPDDAANCESINRRAVDEEAATVIATTQARLRDRLVGLRMLCPRAVGRGCAGTLSLALGRAGTRIAGSARYRIARGRAVTVQITLRAADAARVRRASGGLITLATSRERGRKGAETVIRHVRLRSS